MRTRAALRTLAMAGVLVALLVAVRSAGAGSMATPDMSSVDAFFDWVDATGAASMAMSLVRLGTEIALWYLLVVTIFYAVADATRAASLRRVADVLATPIPRRLVRIVVGVSLATTAAPLPLSGDQPDRLSPPTTMVALEDASAAAASMELLSESSADVAVGRPLRRSPRGVATAGPVVEKSVPAWAPGHDPSPQAASDLPATGELPATWTVAAGESFWAVADEIVSDRLGRDASDAEIAPLWTSLIDTNRDRLVDPADPDLILPGQVFELPARRP